MRKQARVGEWDIMKYVDQVELENKRVLLKADFNVPIENGQVTDDYRIRATLPTINYILERSKKLVICSHLGQPESKDEKFSLRPVAKKLSELLGKEVIFLEDSVGPEVEAAVNSMKDGDIILLENVRFHPEETKNDENHAKKFAALCDVFIYDAFAVAHRKHASIVGVQKFVKERAAGFIMRDELSFFEKALGNPKRPLTAIFGGAKVSTKMAAIRYAGPKADRVVIGGAMANTFFVAQGYNVGKSLYEPEEVEQAKVIEKELKEKGVELLLPVDVVVSTEFKKGAKFTTVPISEIPSDMMALDIGAKSSELFEAAIKTSATVVWNGPMGAFETEPFDVGTNRLIQSIAQSSAISVVGGGDTDLALHRSGSFDKMTYVSTAGGAFLMLMEGKVLPAVAALE